MGDTRTLRILIAGQDPLARAGLRGLLAGHESINVVGWASDDITLLTADIAAYRPDVVVWDMGWEEAADVARPTATPAKLVAETIYDGVPVVALVMGPAAASTVWAAGVRNLLLRSASAVMIHIAAQAAIEGLATIDPSLVEHLLPPARVPDPTPQEDLTPRELEVLVMLAEGYSNKAIALQLDLSEHTVKFHVTAIMAKLNAQSRTEAVVRATRIGLINL